jgi:Secretion system C-terminal sorting domain
MKKIILLFCFIFISTQAFSQIFVENFEYSAGTLLTGTGMWTAASAGGTNAITVAIPGLTFPNYIGSGLGNDVPLTTSGEDDSAAITPRQTSGSVYASFMVNLSDAQSTGDYFFALSTSGNAFDARVYARSSGAGFNFGITKANESSITWGATEYSFGTTYLVVDKYTFNGGPLDDQVSLFVFDPSSPPPAIEPVPDIGPVAAASADAINLSRVILRQGSSGSAATLVIDGIYLDNAWNNVVLPVELASFTSVINGRDVTLNWSTASELNNMGFDIERSTVNETWSRIGNVNGNGTTNLSTSYLFTDRNLASGQYNYRLKQIDLNGNFHYYNLSNEVNVGVPAKFDLSQNYPNPFNPSTKINYDLPFDSKVSIKVFDMSGKEVATLVNDTKTAGYYSINFNASNFGSGVYFYTITADNFTSTKKMMLVK